MAGYIIVFRDDLGNEPNALANLVGAFAKMDVPNPNLFKRVGDILVSQKDLSTCSPEELSHIARSYLPTSILYEFGSNVGTRIESMDISTMNLMRIVVAFSKAGEHHHKLFIHAAEAIISKDDDELGVVGLGTLFDVIHAFAVGFKEENVPEKLCLELFQKLGNVIVAHGDMNIESHHSIDKLSKVVAAYAAMNIKHSSLFERIGDICTAKSNRMTNEQIYGLLRAYLDASEIHRSFFKNASKSISRHGGLETFKPEELVHLMHGDSPLIFNSDFATFLRRVSESQGEGALPEVHRSLFEKAAETIAHHGGLQRFKPREIAHLIRAYALADVDSPLLFNNRFATDLRRKRLSGKILGALHQWDLWQVGEKNKPGLGASSLRKRCLKKFASYPTTTSYFQKAVVSELISLGFDPIEEYITESGYSIDALIKVDGKKVGVEVDGPGHFENKTANGSTILKRRLVVAASNDINSIVSVPYFEWNKMTDRRKKQQYLLKKVRESLNK